MQKEIIKPKEEAIGSRLDIYIHENYDLSRGYIKTLIEDGHILLNSKKTKASYKLKLDDEIELSIPEATEIDIVAEDIPLEIVFEDKDLALINKPINMITHPAPGVSSGTLVNALLHHFGKTGLSEINGKIRPGIVHRLDKDTSGLIIVAKNNQAHEELAKQIQEKTCKRIYQCLVSGKFKEKSLEINRAIGRDPKARNKMAVIDSLNAKSRPAVTIVKLKENLRFKEKDYSYLECELKTGRTHQIRVHLSHIRHPILGDFTYGAKKSTHIKIERPLLHAKKISFFHPKTKEELNFEIDIADDFKKILSILRSD